MNQSKIWSTLDQALDIVLIKGYQSRVLMDTWPCMLLVHMISTQCTNQGGWSEVAQWLASWALDCQPSRVQVHWILIACNGQDFTLTVALSTQALTLLRKCKKGLIDLPIACLSSGSYSIFSLGINFFSSSASSSGVKLMALMLYVRILSFSAGASSNSTVARRQSGRYIIGILVSGHR